MIKRKCLFYGLPILFTLLIGALFAFWIRNGVNFYKSNVLKPFLTPPSWVFPIVWNILYILMGWGFGRVLITASRTQEKIFATFAFTVQLFFNFVWSILFFQVRAYLFAFIWLIILSLLIIWMIRVFRHTDRVAAWMQLPYLVWVIYAGYLNWMVFQLN